MWVFLLIPVAALGGLAFLLMQPPGKVVVVSVALETSLDGAQTVLNASGYVTARTKATVSSKVTARVLEVLIEEGMRVEKGQVIARLDASNVETSLRLAEAQLRAAKTARHETGALLAEVKLRLDRTKVSRRGRRREPGRARQRSSGGGLSRSASPSSTRGGIGCREPARGVDPAA